MSDPHEEKLPYSQVYINAWTILSVVATGVIFLAFCFNQPLTHFFHCVWDLIRYLARPII